VPTYRLRTAVPDDLPDVLDFWRTAAENDSRPPDGMEAIAALLSRDPDALLLAVDADGQLLGTVIAGWDGWRCHLYRLAVVPDRRGQGLGRALIDAAEARFAALGGSRADAMVLDGNELGRRAWLRAGYAPQPEWSRWVKPLPR
jgi:ribosomal protein S18 acetylase RimI-like enzyme